MPKPDMHRRPHPKEARRGYHPRPYALRLRCGYVDPDWKARYYERLRRRNRNKK